MGKNGKIDYFYGHIFNSYVKLPEGISHDIPSQPHDAWFWTHIFVPLSPSKMQLPSRPSADAEASAFRMRANSALLLGLWSSDLSSATWLSGVRTFKRDWLMYDQWYMRMIWCNSFRRSWFKILENSCILDISWHDRWYPAHAKPQAISIWCEKTGRRHHQRWRIFHTSPHPSMIAVKPTTWITVINNHVHWVFPVFFSQKNSV